MSPDETCAVCGRTILAGERTRTYMSPKAGAQLVCDLCRGRAERLGWVDPAARGATVGRIEAPAPEKPAESPLGRLERAAARFNASEAVRTVSGLTRTLGKPHASIGSAAGSPSEVRITVAWDLGWYQWGVDLADERRPVRQIDKGDDIAKLDAAAREWNATVAEGGRIVPGEDAEDGDRDGDGEAAL